MKICRSNIFLKKKSRWKFFDICQIERDTTSARNFARNVYKLDSNIQNRRSKIKFRKLAKSLQKMMPRKATMFFKWFSKILSKCFTRAWHIAILLKILWIFFFFWGGGLRNNVIYSWERRGGGEFFLKGYLKTVKGGSTVECYFPPQNHIFHDRKLFMQKKVFCRENKVLGKKKVLLFWCFFLSGGGARIKKQLSKPYFCSYFSFQKNKKILFLFSQRIYYSFLQTKIKKKKCNKFCEREGKRSKCLPHE